jgi:hypothetical protein
MTGITGDCFTAALPRPYQILGLRLRPLSLGRFRLLRRVDCAFVAEQAAVANFGDLVLGVALCSMTCAEGASWLDSNCLLQDIRTWSNRICPAPWIGFLPFIGVWWRKRNSFDPLDKIRLFRDYVAEASEIPKFWQLNEGSGGGAAHWSESMEVALRGQLGWSREEIEEQPLQKAIRDFFQLLEGSGAIRLLAEGELEDGKSNAAILAKAFGAPPDAGGTVQI